MALIRLPVSEKIGFTDGQTTEAHVTTICCEVAQRRAKIKTEYVQAAKYIIWGNGYISRTFGIYPPDRSRENAFWHINLAYTPWESYMLVGYDVTTDACPSKSMHPWSHHNPRAYNFPMGCMQD